LLQEGGLATLFSFTKHGSHLDMRHVFISYSQKDGMEKAVELQKLFELHGLNPWRDRANIPGGAEWNI